MARGLLTWAGCIALGVSLAACGSHPPIPTTAAPPPGIGHSQGYYKVGRAYQIEGVWYYPKENWAYDETGIASWYGEQFHGRYTADGEIFNLNDMTAAHRTLPMPVVVRVTNLANGRSIKLRVNDRGPYARGRIIDVSRRAAQMLGFEGQGTARVRVQIDVPDSMVVATAAGRGGNTPSVPAVVAALVSAPLALPVSALEAMRGQAPPAAPKPAPAPAEVRMAEVRPVPLPPPAPRPAPAEIKVAESRPVALPPPQPPRATDDKPYLIDDLPGEQAPPAQPAAMPARRPAPPPQSELAAIRSDQIYVQAGAFSDESNAMRLESRLRALGSPVRVTAATTGGGASVYRVRLGPVVSVDAADALLSRIVSGGFTQARIVVD